MEGERGGGAVIRMTMRSSVRSWRGSVSILNWDYCVLQARVTGDGVRSGGLGSGRVLRAMR
jgi:hypothetical protein